MANIRDVAKAADCSISTVSYVLSGSRKISAETSKRVLDAIETTGYLPVKSTRNGKPEKTNTIAGLVMGYDSPAMGHVLTSLTERFFHKGYRLLTTTSYDTICQMLNERSVDGVVAFDTQYGNELSNFRPDKNIPVCFINNYIEDYNVFNYIQDNESMFYSVMSYLISKGCKKIAYLSGPADSYDNNQRIKSYYRACEEYSLNPEILQGDFNLASGYLAGKGVIASGKKYDAIASGNDEMAIGLIEALREHGVSVPDDILVTGYDDIDFSRYFSPNITTVSIDKTLWGNVVAELIIAAINGIKVEPLNYIKGNLVIRESA